MTRFTLRITPELNSKVSEKAKSLGLTKNAWIQLIIRKHFVEEEKENEKKQNQPSN